MKVEVYNLKTGESCSVEGVDAKEYIKSGGWSLTQPTPEVEKVEPAPCLDEKVEPAPEVKTEPRVKPGPKRKTKE